MGKNKAIALKDINDIRRVQSYLKINNYKAFILFQIGIATGFRGGDLIKLTVLDVKNAIKERAFIIKEEKVVNITKAKEQKGLVIKKKNYERIAYIEDNLISVLKDYIRDKEDAEYLYPSQKGKGTGKYKGCIRRDSLGKEFKKATTACGIDITCGTHTPRKTYGFFQYEGNDKSITFVQELFGHYSQEDTRKYIGIDGVEKKISAKVTDKLIGSS